MPVSDVFLGSYWALAIKTFPGALVTAFLAGCVYVMIVNHVQRKQRRGTFFVGHTDGYAIIVQANGKYTFSQAYSLLHSMQHHLNSAKRVARQSQ